MLDLPPGSIVSRGSGQATALIHGALSSSAFWPQRLPRRIMGGRTISYPLPGHYPWQLPAAQFKKVLTARNVAAAYAIALKRDFEGVPVHIMGHSTGGFVAIAVAALYPSLVSRLTIVGGFADGAIVGSSPTLKYMLNVEGSANLALRSLLRIWTSTSITFRAGLATVIAIPESNLGRPEFCRIAEKARLDLLRSDIDQIVEMGRWVGRQNLKYQVNRIRQPTLILAGQDDPVIPLSHQRTLAQSMPNARFAAFSHTGHLPMLEQSQSFCAHVDASFR